MVDVKNFIYSKKLHMFCLVESDLHGQASRYRRTQPLTTADILSQSQLLKCWLKPKRKGVASALTVKQAEASLVLNIVKAVAIGDVFSEDNE